MLTPKERINAAWGTGDRRALHRETERLAAEGVAENVIYDALEKLLLEVRAANGDDETEEKIMGVMDRLTGWCAADRRIKTRTATLPTEEEFDELPAWARVAFAARCVRRALPLFAMNSSPISQVQGDLVAQVVSGVEKAASEGNSRAAYDNQGLLKAGMAISALRRENLNAQATVALASHEALMLASSHGYRRARVSGTVLKSLSQSAHDLVAEAAREQSIEIASAIRRDFDTVHRIAVEQGWTDETTVPPEVFGPLWPEGSPLGWPSENGFHTSTPMETA